MGCQEKWERDSWLVRHVLFATHLFQDKKCGGGFGLILEHLHHWLRDVTDIQMDGLRQNC